VLLVDARASAYRARDEAEPHGLAYCLAGAEQLLTALSDTRDYVGVAAVGREFCWRSPGTGADHERSIRRLLATHPTLSTSPPDDANPDADTTTDADHDRDHDRQVRELRKRLGDDAQVLFLSPLADEFATSLALTLEAAGHPVTVVSPDVTSDATTGSRLARVERENRVHALREAAIPVVDWSPDRPLGASIVCAREVAE
jgi:uncharacterized protein (DUF58 family)